MQANSGNNVTSELVEEENPATASRSNSSMILEKYIGKKQGQNSVCHQVSPCCPACTNLSLKSRQDPRTQRPHQLDRDLPCSQGLTPQCHETQLKGCHGVTCVRLANLPQAVVGSPALILSSHTPQVSSWKRPSFWSSHTPQGTVGSGLALRQSEDGILALLFVSCVSLGKLLKLFEPQFSLL